VEEITSPLTTCGDPRSPGRFLRSAQIDEPTEETSQMRQVQQRKQPSQSRPPELDLCTPSGRRLPF